MAKKRDILMKKFVGMSRGKYLLCRYLVLFLVVL
jgi:hypothetical protein